MGAIPNSWTELGVYIGYMREVPDIMDQISPPHLILATHLMTQFKENRGLWK